MIRSLLPLVLLFAAVPLRAADSARDAASVITGLAAALTAGDAQDFLSPFDSGIAGYERLRAGVDALVRLGETQSFLEITRNEGDAHTRNLEIDWDLRIRREGDATPSRREVLVKCTLELRGRRWRITAFAPVEFLIP